MATYFSGVTLFDGRAVRTKAGMLVDGETIAWVGPHARAPREARAAREVDAKGKTLTPGLFDCHVHLCWDGAADFAAESAAMTEGMAALKAARNAARHLASGVTTVRDLGALSSVVCDLSRAIDAGIVPGPRVIAAGRALTITGGHGHGIFALEVDGADAIRRAVREQIRAGARAIKIIATGGVLTPDIPADFTAFTPEELAAGVGEAHKWGRAIAAHAIGAEGVENAVRAGVDSIEHGSQIGAGVARAMKEKGTFHVPTISALREMLDHEDEVPAYAVEKARALYEQAGTSFRRTARAGVRIACGTDAGTPFNLHGRTPLEIVRMVRLGLTPLRALRAATSEAAALLRVTETGVLAPGKAADLIVYDADPLEDIESLLAPSLVMRGGEPVSGSIGS